MRMPIQVNGEELLTTNESAEYVGVAYTTLVKKIREWNEDHPGDKILGRRNRASSHAIYYSKKDLDKLLGWEVVE